MRRVMWTVVIFWLAVLLLGACQPIQAPLPAPSPEATTAPEPRPTRPPRITLEVKAEKIASQALAGNLVGDPATRTLYVLLPQNYAATDARYPVVYVLPWGSGEPGSPAFDFKSTYEQLLRYGEVKEMILVFPDGTNQFGASLFRSSPTIGDYGTYLARELVDYVDANYRTLAARESRGIAGCSNGGDSTMRVALTYPDVFSVAAPSGGVYDETMAQNPELLKELATLQKLPETADDVANRMPALVGWYIQNAAGSVSNPDNPPLYLDMPFRIVDGKAEIVPEVAARMNEQDSMHELDRYVQQPYLLQGLLIQHALHDDLNPTEMVRSFEHRLTELGIAHEYVELDAYHCSHPWEEESLKFMSEHLVFDDDN